MRYAMAVDTKKCVGCSDCVVACQTENDVPIGYCREWVVEVVDGTYPQLEMEIRSERCNHCKNSPCVRCCPTGASHYSDGGIVLVNSKKCIGCGACVALCPTKILYLDETENVCRVSDELRCDKRRGCERVCPTGAIKIH